MERALFLACLAPFLALLWRGLHAGLGVNPVETVEHSTGDWALRLLCITLAVTPVVRMTGWSWWAKRRRMLGLYVSFYAALHFLTYLVFDVEGSVPDFLRDVRKRPYILVGAAALALLAPLTATSTDAMIRRLKRWWVRIHALIYPAAVLAVLHYLWLVKADRRAPLRYGAVVGALLAWRAVDALRRRSK